MEFFRFLCFKSKSILEVLHINRNPPSRFYTRRYFTPRVKQVLFSEAIKSHLKRLTLSLISEVTSLNSHSSLDDDAQKLNQIFESDNNKDKLELFVIFFLSFH